MKIFRLTANCKKGDRWANFEVDQEIGPKETAHYKNIDEAVLASISGRTEDIKVATKLLNKEILDKYSISNTTTIIEACTDFNLDIGRNSLQMFAQWMVRDCYDWIA